MKIEDEFRGIKLVTDHMCWWDDREQHSNYPQQLDENATLELWQIRGGENVLFDPHQGKVAILSCKKHQRAMVHSASNFVVRPVDAARAEVHAHFRTYFRDTGELWTHDEGRYEITQVEGEWRLMSIKNKYYLINDV